jgi:hypothetical protein
MAHFQQFSALKPALFDKFEDKLLLLLPIHRWPIYFGFRVIFGSLMD